MDKTPENAAAAESPIDPGPANVAKSLATAVQGRSLCDLPTEIPQQIVDEVIGEHGKLSQDKWLEVVQNRRECTELYELDKIARQLKTEIVSLGRDVTNLINCCSRIGHLVQNRIVSHWL